MVIDNVVFLAGLGSPANLYRHLIEKLHQEMPQTTFHVLEWWKYQDLGNSLLKKHIENSNTIVIGHSGGGIMAIQALAQWPDQVKKIIMLDTHVFHNTSTIPSVEQLLNITLQTSNAEIKNKVELAYAPILKDDRAFHKALESVITWINVSFDETCTLIKNMPLHSALHIGFTDSKYQILDSLHEKQQHDFWGKYNIDTKSIPMNHFDLVGSAQSSVITQQIIHWLNS